MLFGNSSDDIVNGWFLGLLSWISMIFYGLIIYDSIGAIKNADGGMNEQQNVTKFYQLLNILIHGLLGISLNFVLRFQLWIGPDSDWAQSIALFPYIQPFFGKIMFIITAALLCLFTFLQLPFILTQFGFFQHRRGRHLLFAWPAIFLPLILCLFLLQVEIPDLRIYSWLFHYTDTQFDKYNVLSRANEVSDYILKMDIIYLFSLLNAYVGNKEFNDFASLMFLPLHINLKNDTKFRVQQQLAQLVNELSAANLTICTDQFKFDKLLSYVNQSMPILKPSLIDTNAFLLFAIPIITLMFFSMSAIVSLTILLFILKKRRTALMKDFNLRLSDIDEIQQQKLQDLDQQIKTALLNIVQVSILLLFLYSPLLNRLFYFFKEIFLYQDQDVDDIILPKYANINSNNLTNLLVALFIFVPLLNFVFSTTSRQQKLKIWLHNCWNNFWKKWSKNLSPKVFIVIAVMSLFAILIFYCYSIGLVINMYRNSIFIGCKENLIPIMKYEHDGLISPLTYWIFLLVNLLFTHSIVKFAWNQIGTLTILNFHFGELLRIAFTAYEKLPWCLPFRPVVVRISTFYLSYNDAYIYQFMNSIILCMDWTPLLIALHRFHIIMVPMQANQFWSKKRIVKACILFWVVMSVPVINKLYNNFLNFHNGNDFIVYKIIPFFESNLFAFICFLYAIMFSKFAWETLFSTSVQILSSSNQLHETRSEMIQITMACFLSYWFPRYVGKRAEEINGYFRLEPIGYCLKTLQLNYFIVEAISLMILSRQYRKIVFADLQLLPLLMSKLWKRLTVSRNQIQQMPQNNNVNGRNQMSNGWVGNLETTQ